MHLRKKDPPAKKKNDWILSSDMIAIKEKVLWICCSDFGMSVALRQFQHSIEQIMLLSLLIYTYAKMVQRSDVPLFRLCNNRYITEDLCSSSVQSVVWLVQSVRRLPRQPKMLYATPPHQNCCWKIKVDYPRKHWLLLSSVCPSDSFPDFISLWGYPDPGSFGQHR